MEQMETAAQAKAARGPKAFIRRELSRIHTPATATGLLTLKHAAVLRTMVPAPAAPLSEALSSLSSSHWTDANMQLCRQSVAGLALTTHLGKWRV